jgi:hypothetical protein
MTAIATALKNRPHIFRKIRRCLRDGADHCQPCENNDRQTAFHALVSFTMRDISLAAATTEGAIEAKSFLGIRWSKDPDDR